MELFDIDQERRSMKSDTRDSPSKRGLLYKRYVPRPRCMSSLIIWASYTFAQDAFVGIVKSFAMQLVAEPSNIDLLHDNLEAKSQ